MEFQAVVSPALSRATAELLLEEGLDVLQLFWAGAVLHPWKCPSCARNVQAPQQVSPGLHAFEAHNLVANSVPPPDARVPVFVTEPRLQLLLTWCPPRKDHAAAELLRLVQHAP